MTAPSPPEGDGPPRASARLRRSPLPVAARRVETDGVARRARTPQLVAFLAAGLALSACGPDGEGSAPLPGARPLETLVRPDTPGNDLMFSFDPADLVETYGEPGGRFLLHYTRDGDNAVPALDADDSGVPDFVEHAAETYEAVLAFYRDTLGFRSPVSDDFIADNGGDDRFDVYLVDFGGVGDGNFLADQCLAQNEEICAGFMIQENDFAGYGYPSTETANRILASHELFHAVQAAYDVGQGSVLAEGTAVWATEQFDPSLRDFEAFIDGYLSNPDRSLDVPMPGPVDPFSYGSAIFFQFLDERYGAGLVRTLWEHCENGVGGEADPQWFPRLDSVLQASSGVSFAEAFTEFAIYNLFTRLHADPSRSYEDGAAYPSVAKELVMPPFVDERLRVFYASAQYYLVDAAGRTEMTARLAVPMGSEAELDGLTLLMVADGGNEYGAVVQASDPTAPLTISDAAGSNYFVIIVVNTLQQGESRRPGLCIGTADEVDACATAIIGSTGTGGAGGSAAGGGEAPAPQAEPADGEDAGGCACRLVQRPAPNRPMGAPAWLLGTFGLPLLLRARHRPKRELLPRRAPRRPTAVRPG